MELFNLLEDPRQISSRRIIYVVFPLPEKEVDEEALTIILSATEWGLSCRETAEGIATTIEGSTNLSQDFFLIISALKMDDDFYPTPDLADLIEYYLERVGPTFQQPEEIDEIENDFSTIESGNCNIPEENQL